MDIIQTGAPVDEEKDFCLERFLSFAKKVTDRLIADGHWSDFVFPNSRQPDYIKNSVLGLALSMRCAACKKRMRAARRTS